MKIRKNKGITLVALVVTIIILVILAGVTIFSIQNTGLFTKTEIAKEKHDESVILEQIELAVFSSKMNENNNMDIDKQVLNKELKKHLGEDIVVNDTNIYKDVIVSVEKGDNKFQINNDGTVEKYKTPPNYGTEISQKYENLYLSSNPKVSYNEEGTNVANDASRYIYQSGNYNAAPQLAYFNFPLANIPVPDTNLLNQLQGPNNQTHLYSGTNQYSFRNESELDRWCICLIRAGFNTTNVYLKELKLMFKDNNIYTLNEAVANKYIEPLVVCNSASTSSNMYWNNSLNLLTGGQTASASFPTLVLTFKVKDVSKLTGIQLYSNTNFNTTDTINNKTNTDGMYVYQAPKEFDISTEQFDV